MTAWSLQDARRWARQGIDVLLAGLASLTDTELDAPSLLEGWSRRHLLAHVALNAEALGRLVAWARTGVRHDMYTSTDQRATDIEVNARRPALELRTWIGESATALEQSWAELTSAQWSHEVLTAQGRTVPARELPWLRSREVGVHALDLNAGVAPEEMPPGFWSALVEDVGTWRRTRGNGPALDLRASDTAQRWLVSGTGSQVVVEAPAAALASWLTGRTSLPGAPRLTRWL